MYQYADLPDLQNSRQWNKSAIFAMYSPNMIIVGLHRSNFYFTVQSFSCFEQFFLSGHLFGPTKLFNHFDCPIRVNFISKPLVLISDIWFWSSPRNIVSFRKMVSSFNNISETRKLSLQAKECGSHIVWCSFTQHRPLINQKISIHFVGQWWITCHIHEHCSSKYSDLFDIRHVYCLPLFWKFPHDNYLDLVSSSKCDQKKQNSHSFYKIDGSSVTLSKMLICNHSSVQNRETLHAGIHFSLNHISIQ